MKRTVFICINGIKTDPGSARAWTDLLVTLINRRTRDGDQAEKFEYFCSALFRRLRQRERAENLVRLINDYLNDGYRVVLIGHSNGCDLIARVLAMGVRIDAVHLFAPAAFEKDFESAISDGLVRRIHIYGSPDDRALKGANVTSKLLTLVGLGYGSLGLRGAAFAEKYPQVVRDHSIAGYGHSTWFIPGAHLEATLTLLLANDAEDVKAESGNLKS